MAIFFITLNAERRDGRGKQAFPFKCDQASVVDLLDALKRSPRVLGSQLVYESDPTSGEKIVTRETARTISDEEVNAVQQSNARFRFSTPLTSEKGPRRAMPRALDGTERDETCDGAGRPSILKENDVVGRAFHV